MKLAELKNKGPSVTTSFVENMKEKALMTQQDVIEKNRKSLLVYAQRCKNVKKACEAFGVSRSTLYKVRKQLEKYGHVKVCKRSKPRMPNKIRLSTVKFLLNLVQEEPSWGC